MSSYKLFSWSISEQLVLHSGGQEGKSLLVLQTPVRVLGSSIFLLLSWRLRKTGWHHPLCKKLLCISACQVGYALPLCSEGLLPLLACSCLVGSSAAAVPPFWQATSHLFALFQQCLCQFNITFILENMQLQFSNLIMHASTFVEQLFSSCPLLSAANLWEHCLGIEEVAL